MQPKITRLEYLKCQIVSSGDGCLVWPYARDAKGLGRVRFEGEARLVHRVAHELSYGIKVPSKTDISQTCGNHLCFRPIHLFIVPTQLDLLKAMLSKVNDDPNLPWNSYQCLEWPYHKGKEGYGALLAGDKARLVHRVAWTISRGPLPDITDLLHYCDNPACFRPIHLHPGSHLENMRDRDRKGRRKYKLSLEQAEDIRKMCAAGMVQNDIARHFSVTPVIVSAIKHNRIWRPEQHS